MKKLLLTLAALLLCLGLAACAAPASETPAAADAAAAAQEDVPLTVSGDAVPEGEVTLSLRELYAAAPYAAVYSTINNWPTKRAYAASGVLVADILAAAGVTDYATVNFASADGYQYTLTYEQLNQARWHYPGLLTDDPSGAVEVEPIIALEWREDNWDLSEIRPDRPTLIIGMSNFHEHTNPLFIANVYQLTASRTPPEQWPPVGIYPASGPYRIGDTIKLQHESFGLVKIYYTLDGSDPTPESAMYNPSTYQPELNQPLTVSGDMLIKAVAVGYGKTNSEIMSFAIKVSE